jgi:hypothetical protein
MKLSKEIEEAVYKMMNEHAGTVAKYLTNMYDTLKITDKEKVKQQHEKIEELIKGNKRRIKMVEKCEGCGRNE